MAVIEQILAREILDSRGFPTVEVDLVLHDGSIGRASVPSGASTGSYEAVELRDGDARYEGKGVQKACKNVTSVLLPAIKGQEDDQTIVDQILIETDGNPNKSHIGANAILAVSLALAKAASMSQKKPLWEYFRNLSSTAPDEYIMPVPLMNILNGGRHADNSVDIQEFIIIPVGARSFREAVEMGSSVFHALKNVLKKKKLATTVGDEGGFAPTVPSNETALDLIEEAVKMTDYSFGTDIVLGLDVASSELFHDGSYVFTSENKTLSRDELVAMYQEWMTRFPIVSLEDPLHEDDWQGYSDLTKQIGDRTQIIGDDLYVTNVERLKQGIADHASNAILIKLNQIGTVTETIAAIDLARQNSMKAIVSHRSGETEDTTIADFVVGLSTGQIKAGSLSRTDRVAKYNQLMRIEETLGSQAIYPGRTVFNNN